MLKNMKYKKENACTVSLILMCTLFVLWSIGFLGLLYSSIKEPQLMICFMVIILLFYAYIIYVMNRNRIAYQHHIGKMLPQHSNIHPIIKGICILLSGFFTGYLIIQIANNSVQFSQVSIAFVLSVNVVYLMDMDLIIIENERVFIHHKWMNYDDIRKIDTDRSIKKYIVVLIFEKKMYSQRMHPALYKQFEQEIQKYYKNEYRDIGSQ